MDQHVGPVVIARAQLTAAVARLADRLAADYAATGFTAVVLLEGARRFAADLKAALAGRLAVRWCYLRAKSYSGTASSGKVHITGDGVACAGLPVVVIDDIYDTGATLTAVGEYLSSSGVKNLRYCVLLEKSFRHSRCLAIDYLGLAVDDLFIIGYGLDYNGSYRDLPDIHVYQPAPLPGGPL